MSRLQRFLEAYLARHGRGASDEPLRELLRFGASERAFEDYVSACAESPDLAERNRANHLRLQWEFFKEQGQLLG